MRKGLRQLRGMLPRLLPCFLFALGAFLRIYRFASVPSGYQMDEAYSAWNAYNLYHTGMDSAGKSWPVYFEAWGHGMNALNSYLMLPWLLFTRGKMYLWVVRLPQLIVSLATLAALYFVNRRLAGKRFAAIALFLLATAPWHIMVSRWGLESQLVMGFLVLGFCFLIYGLEKPKLLAAAGLSYGLALYCYATIWPILPLIIALELLYCIGMGRLKNSRWLWAGGLVLAAMALPLMGFLLVNMGKLEDFRIGCFSVYRMTKFRSGELAHSFAEFRANLDVLWKLLRYQNVQRSYDVISPYKFFYQIGRIFVALGLAVSLAGGLRDLVRRRFSGFVLLWIQLLGAIVLGGLIEVGGMTQINCIYIPLIVCEAVGVYALYLAAARLGNLLHRKMHPGATHADVARPDPAQVRGGATGALVLALLAIVYLWDTAGFVRHYFTDYASLAAAYFQSDTDVAIRHAKEAALATSGDVYVNAAIKYPNVALYVEADALAYLSDIVYDPADLPAPLSFAADGITWHMGYDAAPPDPDGVYVLYYTEAEDFAEYALTPFGDWWYVAVPK